MNDMTWVKSLYGSDRLPPPHHSTNNIVERTVSGRVVFTAIFPSLEPGNYTVGTGFRYYNEVTAFAGRATEVDWR
jgi:hypothetical protein